MFQLIAPTNNSQKQIYSKNYSTSNICQQDKKKQQLTFRTLWAISADDELTIFVSQKTRFDISCKL